MVKSGERDENEKRASCSCEHVWRCVKERNGSNGAADSDSESTSAHGNQGNDSLLIFLRIVQTVIFTI